MKWLECSVLELSLDAEPSDRAAAIPDTMAASARALLSSVCAGIPESYRPLADAVRLRTANRFQAEVRANADRLGVTWRDLLLANVSYDLALAALGCSTVALATPSGPVLARNMDWWPEDLLARASLQTRWMRSGTLAFATAGWPGATGVVSGLSGRGFALVLNAVSSSERFDPLGYPMLLFLRRVIEDAGSYAEALALLQEAPLASPGLVTLVGTRNDERVVIERTPRRAALRSPKGLAPLVTTNAYRAMPDAGSELSTLGQTACHRFEALEGAAVSAHANGARQVPDSELLYWLTDDSVIQTITAQHVIIRPAAGTLRLFVPSRLVST